ncbi:MAG: tetratricopeptide repeat protein [Candidatus Omnitrophica bacterium]|nr:tetratricopeptide repeat protein [Candidatus Omnitrophota bacterium]
MVKDFSKFIILIVGIILALGLFSLDGFCQSAEDYVKKGMDAAKNGNTSEAASYFSKAAALDPKLAAAYAERGKALKEKGDLNQAIEEYNRAVALNPGLSSGFQDRKRYSNPTIDGLTKKIDLSIDLGETYYERAIAYFYSAKYELAWQDVLKAQNLGYTVNPAFVSELKKVLERKDDTQKK